jgi:Protein-L-isoaspartate(D-aspartate) O-methyltransferase (PCMT)
MNNLHSFSDCFAVLKDLGPYDVIHVGAAGDAKVCNKLIELLKPGGRLVIPQEEGVFYKGARPPFDSLLPSLIPVDRVFAPLHLYMYTSGIRIFAHLCI